MTSEESGNGRRWREKRVSHNDTLDRGGPFLQADGRGDGCGIATTAGWDGSLWRDEQGIADWFSSCVVGYVPKPGTNPMAL